MTARWLGALAAFLVPAVAFAGDPTAHTAAAVQAARRVHDANFPMGVGAPRIASKLVKGLFQIPTGQNVEVAPCGYLDIACATSDPSGEAINAPDSWSCLSPSQPAALSILNLWLSFGEAALSSVVTEAFDAAAMACNYNHFASNPALGSLYQAGRVAALVRNTAMRIPASIASPVVPTYCTVDSWNDYYSQIMNSLHYLQDAQTEHHAIGNVACGPTSFLPVFTFNRLFTFSATDTCAGFLVDTLARATGVDPPIACDEEIVDRTQQPGATIALSGQAKGMDFLCAKGHGQALACMGLERTLRHHCKLPGSDKSIVCSGLGGDHRGDVITGNPRYCEGEFFPGGGQDFLTPATSVSVSALQSAARTWAAVCKQPDDPCDATECDLWCHHSEGKAGYCISSTPDPTCTMHTCDCEPEGNCGGHLQACCPPGQDGGAGACHDLLDTCAASTGRCEEDGSEPACKRPPSPPNTHGHSRGDPHLRTFDGVRYDNQAVGELTLALDADGSEVQVRTQRWGNRNVAINVGVAARVGSDIVALYSGGAVTINHVVRDVPGGETALTGGGTLHRIGAIYTLTWPDGVQLEVDLSREYIAIDLALPDDHHGHMTGLLGNFDGQTGGELITRAGEVLTEPVPFAVFYGRYAESWRITQATSLFDYGPGETTETFTDRSFPRGAVTAADIPEPDHSAIRQVCQAAGVSADWLDDCVVDVAISGDPGFASQLARAAPAAVAPVITPPGPGGSLPGLFPTGVDDAGVALPSGAHDPHYQILTPAQDAIVIDPGFATWVRNTTSYHWVWQTAGMTPTGVTRTFRITFSLDGFDPTTAAITGQWATDNLGTMALNGQTLTGLTSQQFVALTSFTIPPGTPAFRPGVNTLDFIVTDTGGVAGFLVASLQGTAVPLAAP